MKKAKERFWPTGVVTIIFAVALISSFFSVPFAVAQEEKPKQDKADKEYELEPITVTAQKQEENVQEVPASISVFSEIDIEDKKIESVEEIADYVPNLMIFHNGASGINPPSMRGIMADHSYTVTTGLYVDGVPILATFGYEEAFLDIERIEVLRGPQGTLYGKNNETGVINIISKQPDNEFRGKVSAEAGEDDKQQFTLNVSGPVQKDKIYLGISALYYQKDGFIENTVTGDTVDDRERWFGKAHLRLTPTDNLDISLIASRLEYDDGAMRQNMTDNGAAMFWLPAPQDRKVTSNLDGANKSLSDSQSLKITYDIIKSLKLTSVTTRTKYDSRYTNDLDYSSETLFHQYDDAIYSKISQELRLDSSDGAFKWLAGLYYDKADDEINYEMKSDIPGMSGVTRQDIKGNSYSAFAHASYPITGQLSLSGGIRYDKEDKEFKDYIHPLKLDESWEVISPKIALEYSINPDVMVYISASKGSRSGGFNPHAPDPAFNNYDQEELWSYEIGEKITLFDNRLILNGSVYYMDISDMQVQEAVSPIETYLTNAATATGKGFELEIMAKVYEGLDIMAGYGYSDVEFDEFKDMLGDYKGNTNPFAPKHSYNIGVQYRHKNGYYARADLIGYGKMYLDKANEYSRDAYKIVNTKIGYEAEHFDIYLYSKNLFDKEYNSEGYFGGSYTIYSEPREIGAKLVYRF